MEGNNVHKQQVLLDPWEDCEAKAILCMQEYLVHNTDILLVQWYLFTWLFFFGETEVWVLCKSWSSKPIWVKERKNVSPSNESWK